MLLKWTYCVLMLIFIIDISKINCSSYSSSRSSGSRSSGSSGSRGSSSSGSRGSSSSGSHSGSSIGSRNTPRTNRYPITTMPTRRTTRYYPVTTMPTRRTTRYYPVTTMPTRRTTKYHPVTTMPTRKTTKYHPMTTMPTVKTTPTRQPPYNPYFNSSRITATKQPPFNPFFSSTTTKQPPYNPFWTSSTSRTNHSSGLGVTKQPPFNPFFTPTTKSVFSTTSSNRYNGSNFNTNFNKTASNINNNGRVTEKPTWMQTTKITPIGTGRNNYSNPNSQNNFGKSPGPIYTTSKPFYQPKNTTNWSVNQGFTTSKPFYPGPMYNTSSFRPGSSVRPGNGGVYQPPTIRRNNTFNTGSGISPSYPVQPIIRPVQPSPQTTIINNNHYYPQPSYYTPGSTGNAHVTIINNNYNPNHHVIIPSTHYYSYGPPAVGISVVNTNHYDTFSTSNYRTTYHYSTSDTGSTSLGFFLGYQLGRINRPSYYYHSTSYVNHEYVPRYDHYTVHHYYHNADNIPTEAPIQPNAVVTCAGDSSSLCPPGNYPLCTNNGAVMCVVSASSTQPCSINSRKLNCVTSTIPCEGNTSPECKQKSSATVSIPCVSTASIAAGVNYVNNSIIVTDAADSSVKNFCVTILALPTKNETKTNSTSTTTELNVPFQYTTNITGVDILGYYLGYKLQNLLEPSYNYLNYDDSYNYIEKYDHYNVFHYYHEANFLAKEVEFKPEQMMNCAGDSGTFCPPNTLSLCLNDGSVACVADISSTAFSNDTQSNYLNSTISCDKLKSPVCLLNQALNVPIQIPCISTAKIYANVSFMVRGYGSGIQNQYYRTIELVQPVINGTSQNVSQNVTTPREFCVAILATPGVKMVNTTEQTRQVTGIPNSNNYVSLPKFTYKPGNKTIEAYMAYRLGKIVYPTILYMNAFWFSTYGTIQKYDHYTPISYYSGKEVIPKYLEFQAFDLRACDGDSGFLCPVNTTSTCLNDGAIMCLTDLMLTVPCLKYNDTVCVRSTVTCENKNPCIKKSKSRWVSIPCISTATIYGDITVVKNNIYKKNPAAAKSYTDLQPIPGTNVNNTPVYHKAQQFCVTLTALPAERRISEGEKLLESSDSLFGRITSKIFRF